MTGRCTAPGKSSWPTRGAAKAAARANRVTGRPKMRAYRCACGRWHLSTNL